MGQIKLTPSRSGLLHGLLPRGYEDATGTRPLPGDFIFNHKDKSLVQIFDVSPGGLTRVCFPHPSLPTSSASSHVRRIGVPPVALSHLSLMRAFSKARESALAFAKAWRDIPQPSFYFGSLPEATAKSGFFQVIDTQVMQTVDYLRASYANAVSGSILPAYHTLAVTILWPGYNSASALRTVVQPLGEAHAVSDTEDIFRPLLTKLEPGAIVEVLREDLVLQHYRVEPGMLIIQLTPDQFRYLASSAAHPDYWRNTSASSLVVYKNPFGSLPTYEEAASEEDGIVENIFARTLQPGDYNDKVFTGGALLQHLGLGSKFVEFMNKEGYFHTGSIFQADIARLSESHEKWQPSLSTLSGIISCAQP